MRLILSTLVILLSLTLTANGQELAGKTLYGYQAGKKIHFTFDDGPHPTYTPTLLDTLKKLNIKATFFVLGEKAKKYPEIIKRMVAEGHTLASHSYDHPELPKLTPEKLREQMENTEKILQDITGKRPYVMRPPYGALNGDVKKYLKERQYGIMLWNIDTLDWKLKNIDKIVTHTLEEFPKDGGIILLHDIHKTSIESVEPLVEALKAKGYEFVSFEKFTEPKATPKPPTEAEIKELKGEGEITASELNFREGPDTSFPVICSLKKGTVVQYLGEHKGWYKVRFDTDQGPKVGWLSGKHVKTKGLTETLRGMHR